MSGYLHIVCLDAPSPPDYGGAIDMHYKIKALAAAGKRIILHYFDYNPLRHAKGLESDCVEMVAYDRKRFFTAPPLTKPFIVASRTNRALIDRLNADNHPILLEGLHCAGVLPHIKRPQRVVLRMHNDEAAYYRHLAKTETGLLKKAYFKRESRLLSRYQQTLPKAVKLACLSQHDVETFRSEYGFHNLSFVPCFIPWQQVNCQSGTGTVCLYHGNMAVSENEEAALWLMNEVFGKTDAPLVVAGKGISERTIAAAKRFINVRLVNDSSIVEINNLVAEAHVNVLPSLNATGVKLKLLNALLNGRHCITNEAGVRGSEIREGIVVAETAEDWLRHINSLMQQPFSPKDAQSRTAVLETYDNRKNAEKLIAVW